MFWKKLKLILFPSLLHTPMYSIFNYLFNDIWYVDISINFEWLTYTLKSVLNRVIHLFVFLFRLPSFNRITSCFGVWTSAKSSCQTRFGGDPCSVNIAKLLLQVIRLLPQPSATRNHWCIGSSLYTTHHHAHTQPAPQPPTQSWRHSAATVHACMCELLCLFWHNLAQLVSDTHPGPLYTPPSWEVGRAYLAGFALRYALRYAASILCYVTCWATGMQMTIGIHLYFVLVYFVLKLLEILTTKKSPWKKS
jgi:hypothetical protein